MATVATALARELEESGHDVVLAPLPGPFRPDASWRTGRRLRDADVLLVVHDGTAAAIPARLALIHAARGGERSPTVIGVVDTVLPRAAGPGAEPLVRRFLASVDVALVHSSESADLVRRLGATDVAIASLPDLHTPAQGDPDHGGRPLDLSGAWARYVAVIEAVAAAPSVSGGDDRRGERRGADLVERAAARLTAGARTVATLARAETDLTARDLPEWLRATDVLTGPGDADDAVDLARSLGLPRPGPRGALSAWAALGALSAVVRVRDGDRRASLIVDTGAPTSLFSRWARAIGYAPVALDPSDPDLDPASVDVIARLHPRGCTAADVDTALAQASRLLRRGGLVALTVPVATNRPADSAAAERGHGRWARRAPRAARVRAGRGDAALLPADLRAVVARADTLGLALVGDLDRDITPLLATRPEGSQGAGPEARSAYALVRLTLRRTGA